MKVRDYLFSQNTWNLSLTQLSLSSQQVLKENKPRKKEMEKSVIY